MIELFVCEKCGNVIESVDGKIISANCDCIKKEIGEMPEPFLMKHVPTYKKIDNKIEVTVGETVHPMEEDHYIVWIAQVTNNTVNKVFLKPGDEPKAKFAYIDGSVIYAYCNKHGLFKCNVK